MNKKELRRIKKDTRPFKVIAQEYGMSYSTVFYIKRGVEYRLLSSAKERAKAKGIEFDLTIEDIVVPKECPLLNIRLETHLGTGIGHSLPNSPTLDRKDPALGYVKGNVWVISNKANAIKNSSTFDEFEAIYHNWRRILPCSRTRTR